MKHYSSRIWQTPTGWNARVSNWFGELDLVVNDLPTRNKARLWIKHRKQYLARKEEQRLQRLIKETLGRRKP